MRNFFMQSLFLSMLTTQFIAVVFSLAIAEKDSSAALTGNSGIVSSLYPRSSALKQAPLPEKENAVETASGSPRGQRCVKCGGGNGYGNYYGYQDRYYDDYYNYYNRDRGNYYGREDPYYYNREPYYPRQDRNWYYQQDRSGYYDRTPYDRNYNYYNSQYDDRYYGRTNPYEYNNNPYNYNSYRGNGYDNLNPQYYEAMRDRFQRERNGYNDYYDRYYDRPANRGYYDNRNFRPYDETYRGTAGFDVSGRGYYFANQSPDRPPHYPPPPYEQAHSKPLPEYFNNIPNHHQYSPHSTPIPEFYLGKPAQSPSSSSSSNSHNTQTVSSGTIGIGIVDSGGGSSSNKNNKNNELDNKDKASTAYGSRPQSLGSSYLFDRTNDDANVGSDLSPPANGDKKKESANMEMKSE